MEVARDVERGIRSRALADGRTNRLTGLYLAEAAERGVAPTDLPDAAARELDLTEMSFRGRCLAGRCSSTAPSTYSSSRT